MLDETRGDMRGDMLKARARRAAPARGAILQDLAKERNMAIQVERDGPVTTVLLDRPAARNAVDRRTAEELAAAFAAFDADPEALVGVLAGESGTFCAGADLKAIAAGEP